MTMSTMTMMHRVTIILALGEVVRDPVLKERMTETGHLGITFLGMKGADMGKLLAIIEPLMAEAVFSLRKQGMSFEKIVSIANDGIRQNRMAPISDDWVHGKSSGQAKKSYAREERYAVSYTGRPMLFNGVRKVIR